MNKSYFYVYLIIDTVTGKLYIGSRKSYIKPEDDIGKHYFSSSKDKEFIRLQKLYPKRFRYVVIKEFSDRKEAIKYESKLHKKFDVANNPMFYNMANQTETGFIASKSKYKKIKESLKKIKHQQGKRNSMYGTKWIVNHEKKLCTRIGKKEKIPKGWEKGRKMDYKHLPREYLEI
jgi:hypothetical protein